MAIEDLSTTTIFMMIFGLVRARARAGTASGDAAPPARAPPPPRATRKKDDGAARARAERPRGRDSGRPAQVLLSFGGGALAAYIYDEDRKKDK